MSVRHICDLCDENEATLEVCYKELHIHADFSKIYYTYDECCEECKEEEIERDGPRVSRALKMSQVRQGELTWLYTNVRRIDSIQPLY